MTNDEKPPLISWSVYSEILARLTPVTSRERVGACFPPPCVLLLSYLLLDLDYLTQTSGKFSSQCLTWRFLRGFTVMLPTTSFGRAFQVVILIG